MLSINRWQDAHAASARRASARSRVVCEAEGGDGVFATVGGGSGTI
jgi:hypothetical protein